MRGERGEGKRARPLLLTVPKLDIHCCFKSKSSYLFIISLKAKCHVGLLRVGDLLDAASYSYSDLRWGDEIMRRERLWEGVMRS
jgi:hypothetical protein